MTQDNQDQFTPIVDELMIKYGASMYVGPEMRLAMAIGSIVFTVHKANTGDVRTAQVMAQMSAPAPKGPPDL